MVWSIRRRVERSKKHSDEEVRINFRPEARSLASSCSSANQQTAPSPPFDNVGDVIVPSNDKEGWCRNKKYIQTVPSGFKCLVCSKIYGRYNSVSYHITVYHRSPPIRCDVAGCQFTTREARYIYFHKYYRHGVPLPESIDTASRKCPFFSCRHVSKSPAMLEKHIARHVSDCSKNGCYSCPVIGSTGIIKQTSPFRTVTIKLLSTARCLNTCVFIKWALIVEKNHSNDLPPDHPRVFSNAINVLTGKHWMFRDRIY